MAVIAIEDGARTVTVVASAAIEKNRFVVRGSTGKYAKVGTANTIQPDGISAEAAAGDLSAFSMKIPNGAFVQVEAGAAMATDGVLVMSDATGRAIAWATGAGRVAAGRLCGTAAAAGEMVQIQFVSMGSPDGA